MFDISGSTRLKDICAYVCVSFAGVVALYHWLDGLCAQIPMPSRQADDIGIKRETRVAGQGITQCQQSDDIDRTRCALNQAGGTSGHALITTGTGNDWL